MTETDFQLLDRYTRHQAEDAFAELVRRRLNLVYSAALRQVRSPQLAEEVASSTFLDLARAAPRLVPGTVVSAWLYQVARRTAVDVVRREVARQLREQVASELTAMNAPVADWTAIEPLLDEAMHALDQTDRTAVLLRYFENRSLREVGAALGTSEDAAQKRVARAVGQLRDWFDRRGIKTAAGGLGVVISTNAVQAAPAGLAASIFAAASPGGSSIVSPALATAALTLAMTTLQKSMITVAFLAAVGIGTYFLRYDSHGAILPKKAGHNAVGLADTKAGTNSPDPVSPDLAVTSAASETPTGQPIAALPASRTPGQGGGFGGSRFGSLRQHYDGFFSTVGLSPAQGDAFATLALERDDVINAAIAPAPNDLVVIHPTNEPNFTMEIDTADPSDWPVRIAAAVAPVDAKIRAAFGDAVFAAYREYDDEAVAAGLVEHIQSNLPDDPLSPDVSARLVKLVAAANPQFNQVQNLGGEQPYINELSPEMISLLDREQLATLESSIQQRNASAKKIDDAIAAAKATAKN